MLVYTLLCITVAQWFLKERRLKFYISIKKGQGDASQYHVGTGFYIVAWPSTIYHKAINLSPKGRSDEACSATAYKLMTHPSLIQCGTFYP